MFDLKFGGNLNTETLTEKPVVLSTHENYKIMERSVQNIKQSST
jgi:hypothetical protein